MARFGLQKEKEVRVLLKLAIIGVMALCWIHLLQGALYFALLSKLISNGSCTDRRTYFILCHAILDEKGYS